MEPWERELMLRDYNKKYPPESRPKETGMKFDSSEISLGIGFFGVKFIFLKWKFSPKK